MLLKHKVAYPLLPPQALFRRLDQSCFDFRCCRFHDELRLARKWLDAIRIQTDDGHYDLFVCAFARIAEYPPSQRQTELGRKHGLQGSKEETPSLFAFSLIRG